MQEIRDKVLEMIRARGPSLPVQVSKQLGTNSIMAGAILATLLEQKYLKISNAKIGGSPVYYIEGQEGRLGQTLYPHMKEVHKKAFDLLKGNLVLEDAALEPWQRVALRELGDFAKKLTIYTGEIFWKWHLIDDKVAEEKIKELIDFDGEVREEEEQVQDIAAVEGKMDTAQNVQLEELKTPREIEIPQHEVQIEDIGEINDYQESLEFTTDVAAEKETRKLKPQVKREKPAVKVKERKEKEGGKKKLDKKGKEDVDDVFAAVDDYFNARKIEVAEAHMIAKGKEYEFIVAIPSNVGRVRFFVKYRNKKSIAEGDLSLALNTAIGKKLPLLFLSSGSLNARAKQYVEKNGVVFERI